MVANVQDVFGAVKKLWVVPLQSKDQQGRMMASALDACIQLPPPGWDEEEDRGRRGDGHYRQFVTTTRSGGGGSSSIQRELLLSNAPSIESDVGMVLLERSS